MFVCWRIVAVVDVRGIFRRIVLGSNRAPTPTLLFDIDDGLFMNTNPTHLKMCLFRCRSHHIVVPSDSDSSSMSRSMVDMSDFLEPGAAQ
jgi:hypothetical protein